MAQGRVDAKIRVSNDLDGRKVTQRQDGTDR